MLIINISTGNWKRKTHIVFRIAKSLLTSSRCLLVAQQLSRADKFGLVLAAYCKDPNDSSQALKFLCSQFRVFMLSAHALNMNGIHGEDITCLIQVNIAVA